MRLHAGFHTPTAHFQRPKWWIGFPSRWGATLRDNFSDVEDDAARYALMSCHFEERLADFAPMQINKPVKGFKSLAHRARSQRWRRRIWA